MAVCLSRVAVGSKEAWELPTSGVASFRVEYHPESNTSGHYTFDHQVML